ncbi:MAG: recombinase family protein, partial [Rhodoplanes sp.]
ISIHGVVSDGTPRANAGIPFLGLNHPETTSPASISTTSRTAPARGVVLGGPKLPEARVAAQASIKTAANHHASNVLPIINEIRKAGARTLRDIADALNARGISTPRGGRWYASSVKNVLARS